MLRVARSSSPVQKETLQRLLWILILILAALFLQDLAVALMGLNWVPVASLGCALWMNYTPMIALLLLIAVGLASGGSLRDALGLGPFAKRWSWLSTVLHVAFLIAALLFISKFLGSFVRIENFNVGDVVKSSLTPIRACTAMEVGKGQFGLFVQERARGFSEISGLFPLVLMAFLWAFTQELLFRGITWSALRRFGISETWTLILQAVVYTVPFHSANTGGILALSSAGLWWGWLRKRDGNVFNTTLLHTIALWTLASAGGHPLWMAF